MPDIDATDIVLNSGPGGYGAGVKPQWFNPALLADYGGPTFPSKRQGPSMPDPNQPQQGALNSSSVYGAGALQDAGPQMPPQQMENPNAFGDGLQNVGAWLQAANNPGGAASLLQGIQAKQKQFMPQIVDMGNDMLGQKRMPMLYDPRTQTMRPMGQQGGGNQSSGAYASDGTDFSKALDDYKAGKIDAPALQKSAPSAVQQEADALVKGTANPSNLGNRNPGIRAGGLILAHIQDPDFNENQIPARAKAASSLISTATGTLGGNITAAGAVANHAASYMENARKLQELQFANGDSNDANWVQSFLKSHSTDTKFKAIVNAMNADADFLSSEGVKSATGGPGSLADRAQLRTTLDVNRSLPEKQAAAGAVLDLMMGRLTPAVNNYNEAFGKTGKPGERTPQSFLDPHTLASIEKVMSTGQPAASAAAPAGGGPTAAAPGSFTGRTASGPGGAKLRETSNGDWVQ